MSAMRSPFTVRAEGMRTQRLSRYTITRFIARFVADSCASIASQDGDAASTIPSNVAALAAAAAAAAVGACAAWSARSPSRAAAASGS
jgi:hypothetical protein